MILIAGGEADHNIDAITRAAEARGVDLRTVRVGPGNDPAATWDVQGDTLVLDGKEVRPDAIFIRYDVFNHKLDPRPAVATRALAWFNTVQGWGLAHGVRMMNLGYRGQGNKPYMLSVARRVGLTIPRTVITNELDLLERTPEPRVAKPVSGGGYCQPLEDLLERTERRNGRAASPAIVQERLVPREVRVFGVGGRFIPFHITSDALDYRTSSETRVIPLAPDDIDPGVTDGLAKLMAELKMDFAAADFKTSPETGKLVFLEINSSPMFAGFDAVSDGAVSAAILAHLTGAAG
ncbi:MAG TPA: hypothetical protein VE913_15150 [Longimicrobium sp.]|nr:hypothetical protein [Longimicrobium sp.]